MNLYLVKLTCGADCSSTGCSSTGPSRLEKITATALAESQISCHVTVLCGSRDFMAAAEAGSLKNSRIIFAADIDQSGVNMECAKALGYLHGHNAALDGSVGGAIIDGCGELFTKDLGRKLVFAANMAGCAFPGKPLVEGTGSLANFAVNARLWNKSLEEAYVTSCRLLIEKVASYEEKAQDNPKILAVHAGSRRTSNSLRLWEETAAHLEDLARIEEISIRNGQLWDCRGCKYEECLHFGENDGCFYGGVMVDKVYPAILRSDILVLICPNYNDSVSANIMAFINRLTAIFRTNDFSRKRIYAIVVSGYSGGDIVAQQIIGAINMNKNFILPPNFALIETANDPGTVMQIPGIEEKAEEFARRIISCRTQD